MNKQVDTFAEIARQFEIRRNANLCEPLPPLLPQRNFSTEHNPKAAFKPLHQMENSQDFNDELKKLRATYQKYLIDNAPELRSYRTPFYLDTFQWRKEMQEDLTDFAGHTLLGKGDWEKVTIPHYGLPVGKASTYYTTEFMLSEDMINSGCLFVCFKGVDYKAHVFVNTTYLGSHEGFFAPFEFDFSRIAKPGLNTLLVKVENDAIFMGQYDKNNQYSEGDKLYAATGCGFDMPGIGWHHCPPGMGIYQDVYIEARPALFINDLYIRPDFHGRSITVIVEIYNCLLEQKEVSLKISVYGQNFDEILVENLIYRPETANIKGVGDVEKSGDSGVAPMLMGPGLNYIEFEVKMEEPPRRWYPSEPWLYQVQMELLDKDETVIDTNKAQFGFRDFKMDVTQEPKGVFYLNDYEVRLRGANTMGHEQQCVIKKDFEQLIDDILIAKMCNLNFLRFTQRPVQNEIYDYCDKLGMMTQTDLPLFGCVRRNKFIEALKQAQEMERLVRKHPCNIMTTYINEPFPNGYNKPHRNLTHDELSEFFKAADIVIHQENSDRIIKPVDGDYDPPSPSLPDNHCYCGWYAGHGIDLGKLHKGYWLPVKPGWNYACGEFGAEGLDSVELMKRRYPQQWLPHPDEEMSWSPNAIPFCQTGKFHYRWFDTQDTLETWVSASQSHQEWVLRLITEAFRRDNRMVSFALHLLIDAFPAGWLKAVVDCERRPKRAYFEVRKSLAPLFVNLRTDRFSFFSEEQITFEIWVCNDLNQSFSGLELHYQVEQQGEVVFAQKTHADIPKFESRFQGFFNYPAPKVKNRTDMTFRAALIDESGTVVNDYKTDITIFPEVKLSPEQKVFVLGLKEGSAAQLLKKLGITAVFDVKLKNPKNIMIDDFFLFEKYQDDIHVALDNGAVVILNEMKPGSYRIYDSRVEISTCSMGPGHFASRKTGHPLVNGFRPDDFKFWYDTDVSYVTPFVHSTFKGSDFKPVLLSGDGQWLEDWHPDLVVGEKQVGKGFIRINQIKLENRVCANPVAKLFAQRLLSNSDTMR